jgi:hypothetical protein
VFPRQSVLRRWQLLAGLALSAAYLSLSSSSFSPWDSPQSLSPELAAALKIVPSSFHFPNSDPLPGFSPRIPSILYPLVQGARLLLPVFRQRWLSFSQTMRQRGISAVEAVQMARFGFVPEFSSPPIQLAPPKEPEFSAEAVKQMQIVHTELVQSSIVEHIEPPDFSSSAVQFAAAAAMCYYAGTPFLVPAMVLPFVHVFFVVPKPHSNKWRGVSGLSRFNRWVIPRHFKMEGLHTVRQILQPLDYMTVIDLKSAYPTMGIHPRYKDYFIYRFRGQFYRYRGAVFGVSSLPRAWTKLLKAPLAFLRSFGIRIAVFLDDLLICSSSFTQCAQDTQDVISVLVWLGFVISTKEQVKLYPAQRQIWCGAEICSLTMMFFYPRDKMKSLRRVCKRAKQAVLAQRQLTLRQWAAVLGTMRAAMFAVLPALLWSQALRRFVSSGIRHDKACWDKLMPQPPLEVLDNLNRWLSPKLHEFNGRPIVPPPPDIWTDSDAASTIGGGMVMRSPQQHEARWHWLPEELKQHINWQELVSHLKGFQALDLEAPALFCNALIRNRTDNSVSMSYVNRQGGRIPLLSLAAESLWQWLLDRGCSIRADFVPGVQNELADTASRWFLDLQEWQLQPRIFRRLHLHPDWGPFSVDAFASRVNTQLPRFWSRFADPDSEGHADAFKHRWSTENLWLCPPHPIIPRVLQELGHQTCNQATLIAPLWPSQPWWPLVLQRCLQAEVLGKFCDVFRHPQRQQRSETPAAPATPLKWRVPSWQVVAFRGSGTVFNQRDTVLQLSNALFARGKTRTAEAR